MTGRNNRKKQIKVLVGLLLVMFFGIRLITSFKDIVEISGKTMGTSYHVKIAYRHFGENTEKVLQKGINERLERINRQMSVWIKDSEISLVNSAQPNVWQTVSKETWELLKKAEEYNKETGGAFDITVGPLVNLWGFGAEGQRRKQPPSSEEIKTALSLTGMDKLKIHETEPKIRKKQEGLYLDLAAIAKGYGVDVISEYLSAEGFESHIVEIGGEIRTSGHKAENRKWKIAVEAPLSSKTENKRNLLVENTAMATSGNYRNFFTYEGKSYSHTINPETGNTVSDNLKSVTVLSDKCFTADSYATALMVMGYEKGIEWANDKGITAFFYVSENKDIMEKLSEQAEMFLKKEHKK